jgi:hypothetical protein
LVKGSSSILSIGQRSVLSRRRLRNHGGVTSSTVARVLRASVLWLSLFVFVAALSPIALAQPAQPTGDAAKADALKAEADALMGNIRYDEALAKYAEAYKLTANPALLYNQGRALESLGRYPEALEMLKAFDAKASPELHARVPNLQKLLADVQGRTTLLTVKVSQAGASIKIGATVIGSSPLATLRVNADKKAKVEVSLDGYDTEAQEVQLPGGGEKTLTFELFPKDKTGVLAIDSPVKGATVTVNGKSPRQVPTEVKLPAGKHTVELKAAGYEDNTVDVVLAVGERKVVTIEPGDSPVYERWWFWTIIGGGLALAGGGVGLYAALTEGPPDQGTIPPCQVRVTAEGDACTEAEGGVFQPYRARPSGAREMRGVPFTFGPVPVLTVHF